VEEGNLSRTPAFDCGQGSAQEATKIERKEEWGRRMKGEKL